MAIGGIRKWVWCALVVAIGCLLAAMLPPMLPVFAAAAPGPDQGPADVDVPPVLAPMVVANRLNGYAYIGVTLTPAGRDKVVPIREKMPFLQDAFLRELNKTPIGKADDPKAVDVDAVKARLTARMNQVLPAGTVAELKIENVVLVPFQFGP